tara:strand:- start:1669 stop:2169 length:501 start_codon:yes stop_codon:yes gene_type:complete
LLNKGEPLGSLIFKLGKNVLPFNKGELKMNDINAEYKKWVQKETERKYISTKGNFVEWFERFLDEKELPYASWELETEDGVHYIDSEIVIEHIIKSAPLNEQLAIKKIIVEIDVRNGDVNHFFKHLAWGLVNSRNEVTIWVSPSEKKVYLSRSRHGSTFQPSEVTK